ncbi:MAG: hypothetical protein ACLQAT_27005 [Candidatus Binataceae bacterium]
MSSRKSLAMFAGALLLFGCAAQTNTGATVSSAPSDAGGCNVDGVKVCTEAQSAGALEAPPPAVGYTTTQSAMPDTAHLVIPNGPTVQVMCYYNPQHTSLGKTDWTSSSALDANATQYLQSKGYCVH